jgi:hypothetical protein
MLQETRMSQLAPTIAVADLPPAKAEEVTVGGRWRATRSGWKSDRSV